MDFRDSGSMLNLEEALSRVGGDAGLLSEIAVLFLGDYPNQLSSLRQAIECQDAIEVEKSAHTLKGSVATFGAATAVQAALALERAGRVRDLSNASKMLVELESLLARLNSELQSL